MKKLFISQPMSGISEEEILRARNEAIYLVKSIINEDVEVLDSYNPDAAKSHTPLYHLAKSIELLSQADIVYFSNGWSDYRGCRIEHQCAVDYNIYRIERNGINSVSIDEITNKERIDG